MAGEPVACRHVLVLVLVSVSLNEQDRCFNYKKWMTMLWLLNLQSRKSWGFAVFLQLFLRTFKFWMSNFENRRPSAFTYLYSLENVTESLTLSVVLFAANCYVYCYMYEDLGMYSRSKIISIYIKVISYRTLYTKPLFFILRWTTIVLGSYVP